MTVTAVDPMSIYRAGSRAEREALHDWRAHGLADAMAKRRELGREYLNANPAPGLVPRSVGFAVADLGEETAAARAEVLTLAGAPRRSKGSLEYPLLGDDFSADSEAVRLAASPAVLGPAIHYFGMLPILFHIFMTRATATEILPTTSHMFHIDPEDTVSLKVFIHLTDVDEGSGPFHTLPAKASAQVMSRLSYRIGRLEDEQVAAIAGPDAAIAALGPAGTAVFCDTTRCLHFGGRPRQPGRPARELLILHYVLPTCALLPDNRGHQALPALRPNGDAVWDALIGASLA